MSAGFKREMLPTWPEYADREGLPLEGHGRWRTTRCELHGGSDSLRVNIESGGWRCMACDAKGGDTLSHLMQRDGLDFVSAARALGAWVEGATAAATARRFSARDALDTLDADLGVCVVVINDARRGITPNNADWERFLAAAGRVQAIAEETRA